jgi:hypothetical protein
MHAKAWAAYASLQSDICSRSRLSDQTWGLEAGLDYLLEDQSGAFAEIPLSDGLLLAIARGRTRERYRRGLRARFLTEEEAFDPQLNLDDRDTFRSILNKTDHRVDRMILYKTALGHLSSEIGTSLGIKSATVRKRLDRLRRRFGT